MIKEKRDPVTISSKTVHVTLHKIANQDFDYWLEKGKTFRSNVQAVLVGLEQNHEEEKGLHAHIVVQFTTRQQLNRKQFVEHFGTDSIHIATKPSKDALLMALGYVSKTGNTRQYGEFLFRGVPLDSNPEVYKFQYQVKSVDDGLAYFDKVIKENLSKDRNTIEKLAERNDAIGRWLRKNPGHTRTLMKLEHTWYLSYCNEKKLGFEYQSFVEDEKALSEAYNEYLKEFPGIFKANLPKLSKLELEKDYMHHEAHDLEGLRQIIIVLKEAQKYGSSRPHKSLNLYIWSTSPSFGKTRLMNYLNDHMMAYRLPEDQYYVDYKNDLYSILISDEAEAFIKSKDYSHLKLLLEGEHVEFNMKGRTKVIKLDNPLIVLAENKPFHELMNMNFKHRYQHEVMATRVLDLELKSRATLHFLLDRCLIPSKKKVAKA
jgi:hypothetical protein